MDHTSRCGVHFGTFKVINVFREVESTLNALNT